MLCCLPVLALYQGVKCTGCIMGFMGPDLGNLVLLCSAAVAAVVLSKAGGSLLPDSNDDCGELPCFGVISSMRISVGFVLYHLLMGSLEAILGEELGERLYRGWWLPKALALGGLVTAAFFIPEGFLSTYSKLALFISFVFIFVGFVQSVDLAYLASERWEEGHSHLKRLLSFPGLVVAMGIGSYLIYFVRDSGGRLAAAIVNLVMMLVITFLSTVPLIEDEPPKGPLQAAFACLFSTFTLASAITFESRGAVDALFYLGLSAVVAYLVARWLMTERQEDERLGPFRIIVDHVFYLSALVFVVSLLENWPVVPSSSPEARSAIMWLKIVSTWCFNVIYTWILFAPVCFPERFSE